MTKNYNFIITKEHNRSRIDKVLSELIQEFSRSNLQKMIQNNCVIINNSIVSDVAKLVNEYDSLSISIPLLKNLKMEIAEIRLDIIYEDNDLIVINKPPNLTVHPGAGTNHDTLVNALLNYTKHLSDIGGEDRPGIVHRLDRDTSGLMVIAKNNVTHLALANQIEKRLLTRRYKALIWGIIKPLSGTIHGNIGRNPINRKKMALVKIGGKGAITHYRTIEIFTNQLVSMIECTLETGRTHQIRVHFSHNKHSIVGDQTYGNNNRKMQYCSMEIRDQLINFKRQALHSCYIAFIHPITNLLLEFTSSISSDMQQIIDALHQENSLL
jgi:23S rRNA pseudouridine1911/1915/1917 synthase